MGIGTMQIVNQATGNKKDIPSGPGAFTGRIGDEVLKTNGTLEKAGEYIDMGVSGKSVLSEGATIIDRVTNGSSLILGVTDKALIKSQNEQK